MRRSITLGVAVLATAAAAVPCRAQPRQGLAECGARPPVRYAAVFDASSSLRGLPALRVETEATYHTLLELLSGMLCTDDRLAVYTFGAESDTDMQPLVVLTPGNRTPAELSATARRAVEAHSGHTDLHLVVRSIVRDLITATPPDAIFIFTDGSYFPLHPTPADRTVSGLRDRLTALATFVADSVRPDSTRLFVVGVNADNGFAIDPDLRAVLPPSASARRWRNVDLRDDHGEDLLQAVFGDRYASFSEFSMWDVLLGRPGAVWKERLGYLTDADLPWSEVSTLSVQHLVYVPGGPGGHRACPAVNAGQESFPLEQASYSVEGGVLCSIHNPTPAQISAIHLSARFFAFRQFTSLWPSGRTDELRGLNDLLLRDSANQCAVGSVRTYFGQGDRWPPPDAQHVGDVRISPANGIQWGEPIELIKMQNAGCVVPRSASATWPQAAGDYFVKVDHHKTSIFRVRIVPPRSRVLEAHIRPGGLPFPSDKIALVRVCVKSAPALTANERMWMRLGDKLLLLTRGRSSRCDDHSAGTDAFSGLVGLEHTDRESAEVFVVNEKDDPASPQHGEWVPVTLRRDGKLFLSWFNLILWFGVGFAVQLAYSCFARRRFDGTRLKRMATWTGALVSGIIVAVVAEFVVLALETNVDSDKIPVIFALSVLAHIIKLLAAALVPEHVEEFLLAD